MQHCQGVLEGASIHLNSVGTNTRREPGGPGLPYAYIASNDQERLMYLDPNTANHMAAWISQVRAAGPDNPLPVLPSIVTPFTAVIAGVDN